MKVHRASATAKNRSKNASKRTHQHDTTQTTTNMQADNLDTTTMQAAYKRTTWQQPSCKQTTWQQQHQSNSYLGSTQEQPHPLLHIAGHLSLVNTEVHVFNITWCMAGAGGQAGRLAGTFCIRSVKNTENKESHGMQLCGSICRYASDDLICDKHAHTVSAKAQKLDEGFIMKHWSQHVHVTSSFHKHSMTH